MSAVVLSTLKERQQGAIRDPCNLLLVAVSVDTLLAAIQQGQWCCVWPCADEAEARESYCLLRGLLDFRNGTFETCHLVLNLSAFGANRKRSAYRRNDAIDPFRTCGSLGANCFCRAPAM